MFKVEQQFVGRIYNIMVYNQQIFDTVKYLHELLIKSKVVVSKDGNFKIDIATFTADLATSISDAWFTSEVSMEEIQRELEICINNTELFFQNLKFEVYDSDNGFAVINEKINNGDYILP